VGKEATKMVGEAILCVVDSSEEGPSKRSCTDSQQRYASRLLSVGHAQLRRYLKLAQYSILGIDATPQPRPSRYDSRFLAAQDDCPRWCFICGTLAASKVLTRQLPLTEEPKYSTASATGLLLQIWEAGRLDLGFGRWGARGGGEADR
jgi:hypothetical protein